MSTDASSKAHLLDLFRYTRWANRRIIDALDQAGEAQVPARALQLLSHLLRAQDVWRGRIQGSTALPDIWGDDPLPACREREKKSGKAWLGFLQSLDPGDLTETVRYENSKGESFENELRAICAHVVNHSTHHRAQIALLLREAGTAPPATDYIFWARSS